MSESNFGVLVPVGGGDPIPLIKKELVVGRAESCDVVLRFPNVSSRHCLLTLKNGYWVVTDLDSRNGTKVNGAKVLRKRIDPGESLAVAKHEYNLQYSPVDNGAIGPPPEEDQAEQIMNASLLQRANLQKQVAFEEARRTGAKKSGGNPEQRRWDQK
ncbi:MAG: FHA domain-containing protein [Pirellulales bacterium]